MEAWLEEYHKEGVRKSNRNRFSKYLEWCNKTPTELVEEFDNKTVRSQILKFQNYLLNEYPQQDGTKGLKPNSARAIIGSVRAFYSSQCESVKGLKGKIVQAQASVGEHIFSLQDLREMHKIANTRDKAILSTGVSLGWEASLIVDMDRNFIESQVKRTKSQKQDFISFEWIRPKTGARIFGILNPCALEDLERYLKKTAKNPNKKLWNGLTAKGLNDILKRLVEESGIVTTGSIRWHLLRKFLLSQLSDIGLNEWECKAIVGKKIPVTDATYLRTIQKQAFEKYKKGYALNLSLNGNGQRRQIDLNTAIDKMTKILGEMLKKEMGLKAMSSKELFEALNEIRAITGKPLEIKPEMGEK